jgi:hypothetical protein
MNQEDQIDAKEKRVETDEQERSAVKGEREERN